MDEHSFWDELAAGYALHGLSAEEEASFSTHLETCEQCAASLRDHALVAAQLGSIAHYRETDEDTAPTWDAMRASILGAPSPASVGAGSPGDSDTVVVDLTAHRRRYAASRRLLAAAAVVAVLAGGGVATWRLTTGGSAACVRGAACHTVKLDAAGGKMEASVVIARNADATVTPSGMAPAPAGKVYVLWQLPRDGRATAVVAFKAGSATATATAALPAAYADTSGFAISEESAGAAPYTTPSNTLASGSAT
jgi:anti-sigma-K factor RskA